MPLELEFEVDKLTRSIEDAVTGEIFSTEVLSLEKTDLHHTAKRMVGNLIGKQNFPLRISKSLN